MKKLSASQVMAKLNISYPTLNNWYKYYLDETIEKPKDMPELPMYQQNGTRGVRLWEASDIKKLKKFKDWIPKGRNGVMGKVSSNYWGARQQKFKRNKIKEGELNNG